MIDIKMRNYMQGGGSGDNVADRRQCNRTVEREGGNRESAGSAAISPFLIQPIRLANTSSFISQSHTFSTFSERERAWLANTTYSKTDIEWLNTASSWDVLGCIMYIPPSPLGSVPIQSHRLTKWQGMNWTTLYCFVRLKANWLRMVAWKWSYPCWIRNGQLRELMINWEAT